MCEEEVEVTENGTRCMALPQPSKLGSGSKFGTTAARKHVSKVGKSYASGTVTLECFRTPYMDRKERTSYGALKCQE